MRLALALLTISMLLFSACEETNKKTSFSDEATYGTVSVSIDESYSLVTESLEMAFEHLYKDAHVNIQYKSEGDVISDILRNTDSIRFGIVSRDLTDEEKKYLEQKKVYPKVLKIAFDAVAIVVNASNENKHFTLDELKAIISGEKKIWDGSKDSILIVFDNKRSGNARYLKEKFLGKDKDFPSNCFAANTNSDVITYVKDHPNAMGVIGMNWISDRDDSITKSILSQIKVCSIASTEGATYYKPYQAYVAQKTYPLCREVYLINREGRSGLGTGFASYIASDKGQRVILKSGLVPATMPLRIVNITDQ